MALTIKTTVNLNCLKNIIEAVCHVYHGGGYV